MRTNYKLFIYVSYFDILANNSWKMKNIFDGKCKKNPVKLKMQVLQKWIIFYKIIAFYIFKIFFQETEADAEVNLFYIVEPNPTEWLNQETIKWTRPRSLR